MNEEQSAHESLVRELNDSTLRAEYGRPYDHYHPGRIARALGWLFVATGTLLYGRIPSYGKLKAIEVVARIPYQTWEIASYALLTVFHSNEKWAVKLARTTAFSRMAQDNETMHVVVVSHIAHTHRSTNFILHTLFPILFSYFYFHIVFFLYLLLPRSALELNYIFEFHAYAQYSLFLAREGERLKSHALTSEFLSLYGREVRNEYEFFELVRNDELVHRNRSIREIETRKS